MTERTNTAVPPPSEATERLSFDDNGLALALYGQRNQNLKAIERELQVQIHSRGNELTIIGRSEGVVLARRLLEQLYAFAKKGRPIAGEDLARAVGVLQADGNANLRDVFGETILVGTNAKPVLAKGLAQKRYVDAIRNNDIVFGVGPAGTGKTFLAMALAVRALLDKHVKRIVLTRPAVEAGERLGFLPGSMEEKVSPYLRPLYDALHDLMDLEKAEQLLSRGYIEVAPIAFMRGRTLNDAFVILDEAQNTTAEQMKMFLTRLGFNSKAVITGDVTQIDLPANTKSGLTQAEAILQGIPGMAFCYFTEVDVVRHPLVQEIIKAYDRFEASHPEERAAERTGQGRGRFQDRLYDRRRATFDRAPEGAGDSRSGGAGAEGPASVAGTLVQGHGEGEPAPGTAPSGSASASDAGADDGGGQGQTAPRDEAGAGPDQGTEPSAATQGAAPTRTT